MPRKDTTDFLAAFAVGAVLGIGATLLLAPERSSKERLVRQLKPYGKQLRRSYRDIRGAVGRGAEATGEVGHDLVGAGKELIGEFRKEVARIVADAREELSDTARDRSRQARRGVRKAGRALGL